HQQPKKGQIMSSTIVGLLLFIAITATWLQIRSLSTGLDEARKEVSRYPLYAARDRLVWLVASGRMNESDEGWQVAYRAANNLLSIHEHLDLFSTLRRMTRFRVAIERDLRLKREVMLADRALKRACREFPEFE